MPSYRVNESTISLNIYDIVGQDGNSHNFIVHTGLAESTGSHAAEQNIPVIDMSPPLREGNDLSDVSVVGSAFLTDDEERKIKKFIDTHASEHEAFQQLRRKEFFKSIPQMYCVFPHAEKIKEKDGRYTRMRFSCVGFVFEAYKYAKIVLLVDTNDLPSLNMELIGQAYPRQLQMMESNHVKKEDLGLTGDGPWSVMLCGYLFHALNRTSNDIRTEPYTPHLEDQSFL